MLNSVISGRAFLPPEQFKTDKSVTICFTGHREKGIIPYNNSEQYRDITYFALKLLLSRYIDIAIESGYSHFISGFAEGIDLWSAMYVLKRKKEGADISLTGAVPYLHHADYFSPKSLDLLRFAEKNADNVVLINPNPDAEYSISPVNDNQSKTLYRDRNYFMVENSSAIIAFLNENLKWSGTHQTYKYAEKCGHKICRFGLEDVYSLLKQGNFDQKTIAGIVKYI